MNNGPIGVFDSGLGGLTALKRLREVLPGENMVYLGDTGRVPYGSKSKETIVRYTRDDIDFLVSSGVKAIIAACNTISAAALDDVRGDYSVPMLGVVDAAAASALSATKTRRIGVIGTEATVASGIYDKKLKEKDQGCTVISRACPRIVPLVESGKIHKGDPDIEEALHEYLEPLKKENIDVLIMGCTHYPLIRPLIAEIMGENITLVDSGGAAAESAAEWLGRLGLLSDQENGRIDYFVTDSTEGFEDTASMFLGDDIHGLVRRVTVGEK